MRTLNTIRFQKLRDGVVNNNHWQAIEISKTITNSNRTWKTKAIYAEVNKNNINRHCRHFANDLIAN